MRTTILAGISLLALASCGGKGGDPGTEIGQNPQLPEQNQYLFPPMHLAKVVGWKEGETPTVAPGLKIEAPAARGRKALAGADGLRSMVRSGLRH